MSIADIRKDYKQHSLNEADVAADPFTQFQQWWDQAIASEIDEVNAMTLATASNDGIPSARIVLLKGFSSKGFTFFTNYNSYKGKQLDENPKACLVFFWKELERQVRITGLIEKVSAAESDEYFNSRPQNSRIGAIASPQSEVIKDRSWLEERENELKQKFEQLPFQRPAHWGGYRVVPINFEFWQGRPGRLHDRIFYELQQDGGWTIQRLAP